MVSDTPDSMAEERIFKNECKPHLNDRSMYSVRSSIYNKKKF